MAAQEFQFKSIGVIRTPFEEAEQAPIQGRLAVDAEGTVELDPAFEDGLADLEGFSHVILIYAFDRSGGWLPRVVPFMDTVRRGVFATRAPRRPNAIGMTVVKLLGVEGCRIHVANVDVLDGTPLLDMKPYVPAFDAVPHADAGWLVPRLAGLDFDTTPRADRRFEDGWDDEK